VTNTKCITGAKKMVTIMDRHGNLNGEVSADGQIAMEGRLWSVLNVVAKKTTSAIRQRITTITTIASINATRGRTPNARKEIAKRETKMRRDSGRCRKMQGDAECAEGNC